MSSSPSRLFRFWQEIKRRNVHRLMAVYGGTAYIIFEASTMIFPRWRFPDWTIDLVLYLLILGAIITFILGWIYDITPEGVRKTKPVEKVQDSGASVTPNGWKFASYISFVVIVGLIFLNVIQHRGKNEIFDKSIAVLPFINESSDEVNTYFINGVMESILNNLASIENLRVISRNTVEKYRNVSQPTPVVAEELDVSYVLEGSGQKLGNRLLLTAQLILAKEDSPIWAKQYDREITEVEDLIDLQKEIAILVSNEIKVVITPEEEERIETVPTINLEAYDFYLRGLEYQNNFAQEEEYLRYAMQMFNKAIEIDSNFVLAWLGLASSCRYLIHFAYDLTAENHANAKKYVEKAKELAPGSKEVQLEEACYYYQCNLNYAKSLKILQQLESEYPNDDLILAWSGYVYKRMGEFRTSLEYSEKALAINPFEFSHWLYTAETYRILREYLNTEKCLKKANDLNPMNPDPYLRLINLYILTGQLKKAKTYLDDNTVHLDIHEVVQHQAQLDFLERKFEAAIQLIQSLSDETIIKYDYYLSKHLQLGFLYYPKQLQLGLIYHAMANPKMATDHFSKAKDYLEGKIREADNDSRLYSYLGIAYAGLGDKDKALEAGRKALDILSFEKDAHGAFGNELNMVKILVLVNEYDEALSLLERIISHHGSLTTEILKIDPFWDPVRNTKKFQRIISNQTYQIKSEL